MLKPIVKPEILTNLYFLVMFFILDLISVTI